MKKIDLFILNYNGANFIGSCVASFLEAIKKSRHDCKLFFIDNKSTDQSVDMIQNHFPGVTILLMRENRVLCSFNDALVNSNADIVFLLNNDLKADPHFIDPMVSVFEEQKDVFFAAAKSYLFDGSYEGGLSVPRFKAGTFYTTCTFEGYEKQIDRFGATFAAGFGAFDRAKFLELGGYDDLYLPGRMEDADLFFRAWRKGWKSYYQPKSILYHMGGKSFKDRFGERGTMEIAYRNTFLFIWKNITSVKYTFSHFLLLIPRTVWMLIQGHPEFLTALIKALKKMSTVLNRRSKESKIKYVQSDRELIQQFHHVN